MQSSLPLPFLGEVMFENTDYLQPRKKPWKRVGYFGMGLLLLAVGYYFLIYNKPLPPAAGTKPAVTSKAPEVDLCTGVKVAALKEGQTCPATGLNLVQFRGKHFAKLDDFVNGVRPGQQSPKLPSIMRKNGAYVVSYEYQPSFPKANKRPSDSVEVQLDFPKPPANQTGKKGRRSA